MGYTGCQGRYSICCENRCPRSDCIYLTAMNDAYMLISWPV